MGGSGSKYVPVVPTPAPSGRAYLSDFLVPGNSLLLGEHGLVVFRLATVRRKDDTSKVVKNKFRILLSLYDRRSDLKRAVDVVAFASVNPTGVSASLSSMSLHVSVVGDARRDEDVVVQCEVRITVVGSERAYTKTILVVSRVLNVPALQAKLEEAKATLAATPTPPPSAATGGGGEETGPEEEDVDEEEDETRKSAAAVYDIVL